jgi:prefoldin subunit 5
MAENEEAIKTLAKEKEYLERSYKESEESLRELLRNR